MPADVFFDTNILLYLLSDDANKSARAEEILSSGGTVSVQVLNEFAAAVLAKRMVDFAELRQILATIRTVCAVNADNLEVHELGLALAERYRFPVYDSMIVAAALFSRCSTLYSEDFQHGQTIERLTIRNPFLR